MSGRARVLSFYSSLSSSSSSSSSSPSLPPSLPFSLPPPPPPPPPHPQPAPPLSQTHRKLVVDVAVRRCERKRLEEEPDGDDLPLDRSTVHNLKLGQSVAGGGGAPLRRADDLAPDDRDLHVLDLDAHEEEVDLSDYHVAQAVLGLVVFEFDVQTVWRVCVCVC